MNYSDARLLRSEFEKWGPWVTKFHLFGEDFGGTFDAGNDVRIVQFFEAFPNAARILELGSLEGGHSFALAARESTVEVVSIEGRRSNIEKAEFVQSVIGDHKVKLVEANVESIDFADLGRFDAVFCSGLLYHLPRPWEIVPKLAAASPNVFIWTQISEEKNAKRLKAGWRGKYYREGGFRDPLSGLSRRSFWLSLGSLIGLLTSNGYKETRIFEHNLNHPKGHSVTLAATAGLDLASND